MFAFKRSHIHPVGAFVIGLVGILAVLPAQSRTAPRNGDDNTCAARVRELEAEVRALRDELRSLSGQRDPSATGARSGNAPRSSNSDGRRKNLTQGHACDPPFAIDRNGIKSYHPECLGVESLAVSCTVPYEYTEAGIKVYKPSCLNAKPLEPSCDPPYVYDSRGLKDYRLECLK